MTANKKKSGWKDEGHRAFERRMDATCNFCGKGEGNRIELREHFNPDWAWRRETCLSCGKWSTSLLACQRGSLWGDKFHKVRRKWYPTGV
jgi:hypothetical protein